MKQPSSFFIFLFPLVLIVVSSCQIYHDTTARFNAYFLAKEKMLEIEGSLFGQPQNDYNDVLPVLIPIDSNETKSQSAGFEYVIEKASLPIQWHQGSKWIDDAYILIGKARLYQEDYVNAGLTFKYVNAKSEDNDARHQALILWMRNYIEAKEFNNFTVIKEEINEDKAPFSKENIRDYHLTMAHYYRIKEDFDMVVEHLELALPFVKQKQKSARYHFILGQIYQMRGEDKKAYKNYRYVLKRNLPYDIEFQASLNASAVKQFKEIEDVEKANKYYQKLLKDDKNWEYRDKIYYEYAQFELEHGESDKAMAYLNESVQVSMQNVTQKAYSYLLQGKLYYDKYQEFEKAAAYYDSAMQILPETVRGYEAIKLRSDILQEFVEQLNIVRDQERLLSLSDMSPEEREKYLAEEIEKEKEQIIKNEENKRINESKRKRVEVSAKLPGISGEEARWYWYNAELVAKGKSDFLRTWGNRPLEDNWRRSQKEIVVINDADNQTALENVEKEPQEDLFASVKSTEDRMGEIPKTTQEIDSIHQVLQEGLYNLGKIYNYKLEEYDNAVLTLERLAFEYPKGDFTPESIYILYLMCQEYEGCDEDKYKNLLLEEYRDTFFAKIIINPNYVAETNIMDKKAQEIYTRAFKLYSDGNYGQADRLVNEILTLYPENSFIDKVSMLRVLIIGKSSPYVAEYYASINKFIQDFPNSSLVPMAENLLDGVTEEDLKKGVLEWRVEKEEAEN